MCKQVAAIIPAYNEEARIYRVVSEVTPFVDEIIVINDGSQDDTARIAEMAGARVISFSENRGYIAAIRAGFSETMAHVVVTIDADGEFLASNIPYLVAPVLSGEADMVQGHRSAVFRPSEKLINWIAGLKSNVGDSGSGLRAIRGDLARSLVIKGACICGVLTLEVIQRGGRVKDVPVKLKAINKPRKIAWFHLKQFFYLLPWFVKK